MDEINTNPLNVGKPHEFHIFCKWFKTPGGSQIFKGLGQRLRQVVALIDFMLDQNARHIFK